MSTLADIQAMLDGVKPKQAPANPYTLLSLAKDQGLRVTSGFSKGTGHNTGSKHYQGSATNPGAIDVDHRGVDLANLQKAAATHNMRVVDERTRPAGQAVWGGPHYHIEYLNTPQGPQPVAVTSPQTAPVAPYDLANLQRVIQTDASGNVVANPNFQLGTVDMGALQQSVDAYTKVDPVALPEQSSNSSNSSDVASEFKGVQDLLTEVDKRLASQPKVAAPQAPATPLPEHNFLTDLGAHFTNAVGGYQNDKAIREGGSGVGSFIGDMGGGLVNVLSRGAVGAGLGAGVGAIAGAGVGAIPGAGAGFTGGSIAGAIEAGTAQDLQAQRLESKAKPNAGRALTVGAIQGALQSIPIVGKATSPFVTRLAQNAALQGGGAALGSLGTQAAEQGTLIPRVDWRRVGAETALGAGGGAAQVAGERILKGKGKAEDPKTKRYTVWDDIDNAKKDYQAARSEVIQLDKQINKQYGSVDAFQQKADLLEQKYQKRSLTQPEFKEYSKVKDLAAKRVELDMAAKDASRAMVDMATPQRRADVVRQELNTPEPQPVDMANLKPEQTTANAQDLADAFSQRLKPQEPGQIVDPTVRDMPGYNTEAGNGIDIATKAPQERGQILDAQGRPITPDTPTTRPLDATTMGNPVPRSLDMGGEQPRILDAQGNPMADAPPKPMSMDANAPRDMGASAEPVRIRETATQGVEKHPNGADVYTHTLTPDQVQSIVNNDQVVSLEEALKLNKEKQAAGLIDAERAATEANILRLYEEAGRSGTPFETKRRELREGLGRKSIEMGKAEVKNRDSLAPVAIEVKEISANRFVENLTDELGSEEAVRQRLQDLIDKYGLQSPEAGYFSADTIAKRLEKEHGTIPAAIEAARKMLYDQGVTPNAKGKTPKANLKSLAKQLLEGSTRDTYAKTNSLQSMAKVLKDDPKAALEFKDTYLTLHNYKTGGERTATDAVRSYPLRTIESGNVGQGKVEIPTEAKYQNTIAQQFDNLQTLMESPDLPPDTRKAISKVTDSGNVTHNDIKKMRSMVMKDLQALCNVWGLK